MKNLELRASLIKSAILLGLCIFFIYAFAATNSGGISGTIGSLFSGALFLAGLALAVIVSIIVMFGIYFGILYMYDKDVCRKTYDEFKDKMAASSECLSGSLASTCCTGSKEETSAPLNDDDLDPLRSSQTKLNSQVTTLDASVDSLEKAITSLSTAVSGITEELSNLTTRATTVEEELENKAPLSSIEDTEKKVATDIASVKNSIQPLSDKLTEFEEALSSLGSSEDNSDDALQEKIDLAVSSLQGELKTIKESVEGMNQSGQENESSSDQTPHRILSYFANKKDEKKFTSLVAEAVAKEMTYAQAGELLNDSLSPEAAEVIAEHPSLTKDYIKVSRQKN
jgi:predicted  nucleic acid-binding Zn-ribbon protein